MKRLTWMDDEPRPLACKVCGHTGGGTAIALIRTKSGAEIEAVRCPRCRSVDLLDDPEDSAPTDDLVDEYVEAGAGISTIAAAFDLIDPDRVSRFLDVGCSYGFALDLARFRYGWSVVGIDPSRAAARGAAELGLDIRHEFLTADTDLGEPFDLILASEVVEHVPEPVAFLRVLHSRLTSTGTLILTTPAAEVVSPSEADDDALCALSPGFHTFVASEQGLDQLLRAAGFADVRIIRTAGTLRATAHVAEATLPPTVPSPSHARSSAPDVEQYLRHRMASAPSGSALAVGMSVRLARDLVATGRLEEATEVAAVMQTAFRERHDVDLADPFALTAAIDAGAMVSWSAVGACFVLGSLDFHLRGKPERAAEYFALTSRLAEIWSAELDIADLTNADLRFEGAYLSAFAQTRFAPAQAVRGAMLLSEFLDPTRPNRADVLDAAQCRLFVELVAQGHRAELGPLQQHVQASAALAARSERDDVRIAGLDALYSLGIVHRDAGDVLRAQAAFVECMGICDSRPEGDHHAAQLGQLCRANLPVATTKESTSVKASTKPRRRFRRLIRSPRRSDGRVTSDIDTYWSDTWGTYLDGWARLDGVRINTISVEAGNRSIMAADQERPDLDDRHHGFSVYLPGRISSAVTLVLHTDGGDVVTELTLPSHPRPEHPVTPPALPDRQLQQAMRHAPDGPALALGVRSLSEELAQARVALLAGRDVIGLDIHPGFGVDVVGDVHQLSGLFPSNHFSVIYSAALLEHVAAPWLVAAECAKVLKPGGIAVHLAPWVWPTHSEPNDFWRFSDRGLASLFSASLGFRVIDCGGSGGAIITPTPDWRLEQIRFPTHSSPAMSWVIAQKVADPDPSIAWPYTESDVATAQEYPVDGLCDSFQVAP